MLVAAVTQRTAEVVAAKDGEDGTAIDGNMGVVAGIIVDESILCTAEEGVDLHGIVGHRDVGLADGRDIQRYGFSAGIRPYGISHAVLLRHSVDAAAGSHGLRCVAVVGSHK